MIIMAMNCVFKTRMGVRVLEEVRIERKNCGSLDGIFF